MSPRMYPMCPSSLAPSVGRTAPRFRLPTLPSIALGLVLAALSCARHQGAAGPSSAAGASSAPASGTDGGTSSADRSVVTGDRLGPIPPTEPLPAFRPPAPKVLTGPSRSSIWWFERRDLPLVDLTIVVPFGSSSDPKGKPGLGYAVARMLTEGAGDRDAIAFAQALRDAGAKLSSSVSRDTSTITIRVLSSRLADGARLLADAVMRPRNAAKDYERVRVLWRNALAAREQDPGEVARVLIPLLYFGPDDPYGHSPEGTRASPEGISIDDVRKWHRAVWRPEAATFVVAGDVSEQDVVSTLGNAFGTWRSQGAAPALPAARESALAAPATKDRVKVAVVDRADAPQVILSIAEPGVAAGTPTYARLSMLNVAFGGSFGSRLNQSLRETHGWTYGAGSAFPSFRRTGLFVIRAAIRTDVIGDALHETLRLAGEMGQAPLSSDEWQRVRAQTQGDATMAYGNLSTIAASLAENAGLGLPADQNALMLASQLSASPEELLALARDYMRSIPSLVVLIGPKQAAEQALQKNGLPAPTYYDVQGKKIGGEKG